MKTTDKQKIKAEIERLRNREYALYEPYRESYTFAYICALKDVEKFINKLPEEPASDGGMCHEYCNQGR